MTEPSDTPSRPGGFRHAVESLGVATPALWWSLLYFFCLLTAYYVLRPVRDAMGASADVYAVFPPALVDWAQRSGVDLGGLTLQLLFTATFICMVVLQPVYGALVSRYPRRVFLPVVYLCFIACLGLFYWAFNHELPGRGAAFFVWVPDFIPFADELLLGLGTLLLANWKKRKAPLPPPGDPAR